MPHVSGHGFVPPWRWGIFYRRPCAGLVLRHESPDYEPMLAIYEALKDVGFKETYWQFVYPGQIGGLIKNARNTLIEYHVRFFEGGIVYAEVELGRSVMLHLIKRRCYINRYIASKISRRLLPGHLEFLRASTERSKVVYPRAWPEWSVENRFMTPALKKKIRLLTILADWRVLAFLMFASIVSSLTNGPAALAVLTALMILIYLLAPRRTQ